MLTPEQKKLVEDNIRLCHEFVHRELRKGPSLTRFGLDEDDMLSIAYYSLCLAARDYDPSLGCQFSTLFWKVCWGQYRNTIRDYTTDKRRASFECISLNAPCQNTEDLAIMDVLMDSGQMPEEWYIEREQRNYVRLLVDHALPPNQRLIVRMYYWDRVPQPQIAAQIGASQASVSRALARARRRIERELIAAGYEP